MRYGFYSVFITESEEESYEKEGKEILEKCGVESFSLSKLP